jgi:hypothetical protein
MIIPDKIKIGGRDIQVCQVDHLSDDEDRWGEYNPRTGTIRIEAGIPQDMKEEVLLHEILEAISDIYGLKLKERQILTISAVLMAIARDNSLFAAGT